MEAPHPLAYYFEEHPVDEPGAYLKAHAGRRLGSGADRCTYILKADQTCVLKYEPHGGRMQFQNVMEWKLWDWLHWSPDTARWLAPAIAISPCAQFLIMARTTKVPAKELPRKVPAWITDCKSSNMGKLPDGRVVMHDYGCTLLMNGAWDRTMKPRPSRWTP